MERIFNDAKDKNVAAVVVYIKGSDGKAYKDAAGTVQFKTSELKDGFFKRALIYGGTDLYYAPVGFTITSNVGKITYAVTTGSNDTAKTELKTLTAAAD